MTDLFLAGDMGFLESLLYTMCQYLLYERDE